MVVNRLIGVQGLNIRRHVARVDAFVLICHLVVIALIIWPDDSRVVDSGSRGPEARVTWEPISKLVELGFAVEEMAELRNHVA